MFRAMLITLSKISVTFTSALTTSNILWNGEEQKSLLGITEGWHKELFQPEM